MSNITYTSIVLFSIYLAGVCSAIMAYEKEKKIIIICTMAIILSLASTIKYFFM